MRIGEWIANKCTIGCTIKILSLTKCDKFNETITYGAFKDSKLVDKKTHKYRLDRLKKQGCII